MRPVRLALLLTALAAVAAAGCGGGGDDDGSSGGNGGGSAEPRDDDTEIEVEAQGDPEYGGTVVYGLNAETSGWDASTAQWAGSASIVANAIFDPLMAYDDEQQVAPYLVESMEPNEDFTTWTVTLRPDVVFHDDDPFDADALIANLQLHRDSFLTGATMTPIVDLVRVDDLEVRVELDTPWATLPHLFTAQPGYMMAPSTIDGGEDVRNRNPVGTGPFEFVSWEDGRALNVERNENYWREGFPYLSSMEFRVLTDNTTRTASLLSGQIDILETGDPGQIQRLTAEAEDGNLQVFIDREGETSETFVALNTSQPPFDNPIARQAVAHAMDTQTISDVVYNGVFPPARGIFKPNSPWYAETDYPAYDPDRARELVAQYEAETGETLSFTANITPQPEIQAVAQLVQEQLQVVGIDGRLESMEQGTLLVRALGGDYEASGFILFGSAHPDRDYVFLHGDNAEGDVALAFTRLRNDAMSEAMDAARAAGELEDQVAQWAIVQEEMANDVAIIFLVHNESGTAANINVRDVKNWTLPDGTTGSRSEGVVTQSYQLWVESNS